jgi:uncharacterized protein
MKYLVLLLVLVVAYMVWRNARIGHKQDAPGPRGSPGTPQEMIACPECGLHLPKADAVAGRNGLHYCSQEHRLRAGD